MQCVYYGATTLTPRRSREMKNGQGHDSKLPEHQWFQPNQQMIP